MSVQNGTTAPFSATVRKGSTRTVLQLSGELDVSVMPALAQALESVVADCSESMGLHIDLSGVVFIDSSCIGRLVFARNQLRLKKSPFSLTCGRDFSRVVIEIEGLTGYLGVTDPPLWSGSSLVARTAMDRATTKSQRVTFKSA